MRKPIIAGNWKMHFNIEESVAFVRQLQPVLASYNGVDRVVCPTFIALHAVAQALSGTDLKVGAQQVHWEEKGAYTSQIAPGMLSGLAEYIIIGHSECRAYLNETDETVNKKARTALKHGFKPIIAVGESLAQNEAGETEAFVSSQVRAALIDVSSEQMADVIIAYEPIWAIGTGKNASGEVANDIIRLAIRQPIEEIYGTTVADSIRIQYGGSVKPDNMREYMSQPNIDGALVGGASLDVTSFTALVEIAEMTKGS